MISNSNVAPDTNLGYLRMKKVFLFSLVPCCVLLVSCENKGPKNVINLAGTYWAAEWPIQSDTAYFEDNMVYNNLHFNRETSACNFLIIGNKVDITKGEIPVGGWRVMGPYDEDSVVLLFKNDFPKISVYKKVVYKNWWPGRQYDTNSNDYYEESFYCYGEFISDNHFTLTHPDTEWIIPAPEYGKELALYPAGSTHHFYKINK